MTPNIKRWDVYDAADHLDDLSPALYRAIEMKDWVEVSKVTDELQRWADKLWAMSVISGSVGPYPFYERDEA